MSNSLPTSEPDSIMRRWLDALLQFDPNLPHPVASAMVQNVARGPLGEPLRHLEQVLLSLEAVRSEDLTGSETRTALAILAQLEERIAHLQASIRELWRSPP